MVLLSLIRHSEVLAENLRSTYFPDEDIPLHVANPDHRQGMMGDVEIPHTFLLERIVVRTT